LLENWVEERAVADIDPQEDLNAEVTSGAQTFKDGHKGLLSTNFNDPASDHLTTVQDSYRPPPGPDVRTVGSKREALERELYAQVSKEVSEEFNKPPSPVPMESITHIDYNILGFVPSKPKPTAHHDLVNEQPVTFWTEHKEKMHGISQIKTQDTPFRKNTSFSKPIEEYWDQTQPYEMENVPKM